MTYGADPLGYNDFCTASKFLSQSAAQRCICFIVQRAGAVIQQENLRMISSIRCFCPPLKLAPLEAILPWNPSFLLKIKSA